MTQCLIQSPENAIRLAGGPLATEAQDAALSCKKKKKNNLKYMAA